MSSPFGLLYFTMRCGSDIQELLLFRYIMHVIVPDYAAKKAVKHVYIQSPRTPQWHIILFPPGGNSILLIHSSLAHSRPRKNRSPLIPVQSNAVIQKWSNIKKLDRLLSAYIWNGKRPRIKLSTLQRLKSEGGLAYPNFKLYAQSFTLLLLDPAGL